MEESIQNTQRAFMLLDMMRMSDRFTLVEQAKIKEELLNLLEIK